jgi:drug/metabolite transporter (DMT)-like permease
MVSKKGIIALSVTAFIWASTFTVIKIGLERITPLNLSFVRSILATFFLLGWLLLKGKQQEIARALKFHLGYIIGLGVVGVALFNIFQNVGISLTSSGIASLLVASNPVFILILSTGFLGEKITAGKAAGIVLGFVGIITVTFLGKNMAILFRSESFWGNTLALLSALCWAVYSVMNKSALERYTPLTLTTLAYVFGSLILFFFCFTFKDASLTFRWSLSSWLILLYLGILASGVTFYLWNYALSTMEASRVSIFIFLVPILAIFLGKLILSETITGFTFLGTALVLSAIYLMER